MVIELRHELEALDGVQGGVVAVGEVQATLHSAAVTDTHPTDAATVLPAQTHRCEADLSCNLESKFVVILRNNFGINSMFNLL
jgi:hypothetical protein